MPTPPSAAVPTRVIVWGGRVLNAIPDVRAAEPGLLSILDLPLQTGAGTMFA